MRKRGPGEGSIYWSESRHRFVAKVSLGERDGKRVRKVLYGPAGDRSRVAKLGLEERIDRYAGRRARRDGTVKLADFIEQSLKRADIREKTRAIYATAQRHIVNATLGAKALLDIEPIDIRDFYDSLTTGPRMKQIVHQLLHRVLAEAVQLEMLARNPAASVTKPKVERRETRVLAPDEVGYLLKAAEGDRLGALVLLSLSSTMGPAELFALRRKDVQLDGGYVIVTRNLVDVEGKISIEDTKTPGRRRRIDLPAVAMAALRARIKDCLAEGHGAAGLIFTSAEGGPLRPNNVRRRWWRPLLDRAADLAEAAARDRGDHMYRFPRDLRFYDLRHTSNALMGLLGVPLQVASSRMGHSSIKTTVDIYGHLFSEQGRSVAEKFDSFFEGLRKGAR